MPVISGRNNRILPANTRAVDVATEALRDIAPIQQRRFHNAFMVQGYSTLLYTKLLAGLPCSCEAKYTALAQRLNEEGKLDKGQINELISGGMEFTIKPYGTRTGDTAQWRASKGFGDSEIEDTARPDLRDQNQETMDQVTAPLISMGRDDFTNPAARSIAPNGNVFGANGPVQSPETIEDLENSPFDPDAFKIGDVSCPVCMGSGFVGGAAVVGGWRRVFVPQDPTMTTDRGSIDTLKKPISIKNCVSATWPGVVLPKGAWVLDRIQVWNDSKVVPASFMVDSVPINKEYDLLQLCDGRPHDVTVVFKAYSEFTHVEMQLGISRTPVALEFPRLTQNTDLTKLDATEDVQIYASPTLPFVKRQDIIVESTFGKTFQVGSVVWWNDAQRRVYGWDMNCRVVQPQELWSLLPRRSVRKQKTSLLVRDNLNSGQPRT